MSKEKYVILTPKNDNGKKKLDYHGDKWLFLRIVDNLKFIREPGPFIVLQSRDGKKCIHVKEKEDPDFCIRFVQDNMWNTTGNASDWDWLIELEKRCPIIASIIKSNGLIAINDIDAVATFCEEVIERNQKIAEAYRKGNHAVLGSLIAQVMKRTNSGANPEMVIQCLKNLL